jgi:DNA-binding CsgD family transcriptional regulator/MoxR-like ATPase
MAAPQVHDTPPGPGVGQRLVGRERELDLLFRWIGEAAAGQGRAVLVEGEPGIGKSALLQAASARAVGAGCAVRWSAGEELQQRFPLLPLLRAFAFEPTSTDPPATAAEELLDHVDQLCAQSPVLLVVDELHWADDVTVAVCHRLARSVVQRPLLLIGAMRPLPRRDDLRALRRAVGREGLLRLAPLADEAVTQLVAALAGGPPGPRLARLTADAAGNPLYLTELVGALGRGGALAEVGAAVEATGGSVPATLAEAIRDRLDFLPGPVRQVLQAGALLGSEFAVQELSVVTARRPSDLAAALADARAAGVLVDMGVRLAFRHPLIRAALYDELPVSERARWHRHAAETLYDDGASVERVASQLLPALAHGDQIRIGPDDWVISWLLQVAPRLAGEATAVAVQLLRAAVPQLPADDTRRHVLVSHLARALSQQNENEAVEALVSQTIPQVSDPEVLVPLFDALARARSAKRERLPETLAAIDQALATVPSLNPTARNRLRVIAARVHYVDNDPDNAERAARPALAAALASGDPWAVTWSANIVAVVLSDRGDRAGALEYLGQGIVATEGQPTLIDPRLALLGNRGEFLMWLDRFEEARDDLTVARALAERTGKIRRLGRIHSVLCELYYELGQWDDALATADLPDVEALSGITANAVAAVILMHRGRAADARQRLIIARGFAEQLGFPNSLEVLAGALDREIAGDPAGALTVFRTAIDRATRAVEAEAWLAHVVRLAVDEGDRATAIAAAGRADEFVAAGSTPRRMAAAAHCRGLLDADPSLLVEAADGYATASRPLPRAAALEEAAALLAGCGDTAAARAPFIAAIDIYTRLGAAWDVTRIRARFSPYGLRQPTRRLNRPTTGWEALTAAEAKVADLVAAGLSNPEIAAELVVSRRTVEAHITRVLAKLQIRSRVDLARVAALRS